MASSVETLIRKTVSKGIMKVAEFNRDRMDSPEQPHPFLTGIHQPMSAELTLNDLKVSGTIPPELDGRYIRIGPNPVTPPNPASYHWFTGDGMVHGVSLKAGKALWYRNRWIKSKAVSAALGQPEAPGPRNGLSDTVNTNVMGIAGDTWALVEAGGYPVRINEELETIAHDPFGGTLKGSFTAHPHLDPETGEMHAICYQGDQATLIRHVVVGTDGKVRREEPITVNGGPSIHDCMITKQYVIIMDMPVTFSMKLLLAGHAFPYKWNLDHKARIGLLPREGREDDVIWCDIEPCYAYHPCNAYETADGKVIMDVCAHDSMATDTQGPSSSKTPLERWTIDAVARKVARAVIDADNQEFPRPDERLLGKPYRYAYTMALPGGAPGEVAAHAFSSNRLFKHDLEKGTREVHEFGPDHFPGEFVFIPKSATAAEDDGWLMGYVVDATHETTQLVILDARNFSGAPQAVVDIPHRIPPGFHGNWVPNTAA
jgi:8'-apo-carotenoid 13,14-cleaving dioxygenase